VFSVKRIQTSANTIKKTNAGNKNTKHNSASKPRKNKGA
jgi:hypothetical protein